VQVAQTKHRHFLRLTILEHVKSWRAQPVHFPSLSVTLRRQGQGPLEKRESLARYSRFLLFASNPGPRTKVSPANEIAATSMRDALATMLLSTSSPHLTRISSSAGRHASFAVESPLAIRNSNDCRSRVEAEGFFFRPLALFPPFIILLLDAHPYIYSVERRPSERAGSYIWEEECKLFWGVAFWGWEWSDWPSRGAAPGAEVSTLKVTIREWDVPTKGAHRMIPPLDDGALWFTEQLQNKLGRVDPKTGVSRSMR